MSFSALSGTADESVKAKKTITNNSHVEMCCGNRLAPFLLKFKSRIVLLCIYVVIISVAIYGATRCRVYFDQIYFLDEDSQIYGWF